MNILRLREYCLNKKYAGESFPFDETTLVFKVSDKIFAITDTESEFSVTLKAKPEDVAALTENYENISGAYHMNKKHWINVRIDGSLPDGFIFELIDNSYDLVVSGMTKKMQNKIKSKQGD